MEKTGLTLSANGLRVAGSDLEVGFSMVEMLMVMFIFAIGLLGLTALQTTSIKQSSQGRQRGTASLLAHSIMDRIQAEGALSSAERLNSANGTVTTTGGYQFINPGSPSTDVTSAAPLTYDITGQPVASNAPNIVFTINWYGRNGTVAGPTNAVQQWTVYVTWREAGPNKVLIDHYLAVNRYVRL